MDILSALPLGAGVIPWCMTRPHVPAISFMPHACTDVKHFAIHVNCTNLSYPPALTSHVSPDINYLPDLIRKSIDISLS